MQTGYDSMGRTIGFELFEMEDVESLAQGAARQAVTKLRARPAPSGSLPVVIKRGSGGVLFHEACGHGLEADLVGKGASVYRGKVGELVASPLVTLIDDGTMSAEWGAIGIDDEGHLSQSNVLIKDGVLTDYMWDYLRAQNIKWFIDWPHYVRKYLGVPLDDQDVPLKAANGWRFVAEQNYFYVYEYVGEGTPTK